MLKQRIVTASILALIFIGTILFAGNVATTLLFSLTLFVAVRELLALTLKPEKHFTIAIALLFSLVFFIFNLKPMANINFYESILGTLFWVGILCFMPYYKFSGKWSRQTRWLHLLMGLVLLWIAGNGLLFMHRNFDSGGWLLLYSLTLVWVADIGAYFSGRRFGRNKLAPVISPGKTWEGAIGGVVSNLIWILIAFWLSGGWGIGLWQFVLLGLCASIISPVGDLYESILKREAGVKDSSSLLPGHGGVLDRIDAVIAATPVFILGLYLVDVI